jgi:polysaccharide deacetylase family protein (PEP-CTERM system associated)
MSEGRAGSAKEPTGPGSPPARAHILTVSVEEYFHAGSLTGAVRRKHWERFESRLAENVDELLALLARYGHTATFFVLGCVAARHRALLRRIVSNGHELGASGYWPDAIRGALPGQVRQDLRRTRASIEDATGVRVQGYRTPRCWLDVRDLWLLDVLTEEGFAYDSSINPVLRSWAAAPQLAAISWHAHSTGQGGLWELPISTVNLWGCRVPVTGGNYARQLPHTVLKHAVGHLHRHQSDPLVFYLMSWELDLDQPQVTAVSRLSRLRHYRNLGKARWVFADYCAQYRFQSVADHLRLPATGVVPAPDAWHEGEAPLYVAGATSTPFTLVVPLYNEEENVAYLYRTLVDVRQRLAPGYELHLVLVDDGSTDRTRTRLEAAFDGFGKCQIVAQPRNAGIAASIMLGIAHAPTDLVGTIDCDCSYDPNEFLGMLPLSEHADIVTASPYHPRGQVLNVKRWRLVLSRTLSRLYTLALGRRLYTFTSCCRVYHKRAIEGIRLEHGGFLGVAEILLEAVAAGATVVEYPATLESRLFGESKLRVARTIVGHIGLLWRVVRRRARRHRTGTRPRQAELL